MYPRTTPSVPLLSTYMCCTHIYQVSTSSWRIKGFNEHFIFLLLGCYRAERPGVGPSRISYVIQVKRVYNLLMTVFRYGREHYEEGEFVRRKDALPGDGLDPVVRIVEDLGTIEIPCGKVGCRANCLEYLVRSARKREDYALAECKISPLVSII